MGVLRSVKTQLDMIARITHDTEISAHEGTSIEIGLQTDT